MRKKQGGILIAVLCAVCLAFACGADDGNDPVDNEPVDDNSQPDIDTTPVWVTDQTYAGLEWSPLSEKEMTWQVAMNYCEAMGARLPNTNELRKIIINCPGSTYGGACQVSDPDCLGSSCWSEKDCYCEGYAESYSALGDGKNIRLWSSSSHADNTYLTWGVDFDSGVISSYSKYSGAFYARCVR